MLISRRRRTPPGWQRLRIPVGSRQSWRRSRSF